MSVTDLRLLDSRKDLIGALQAAAKAARFRRTGRLTLAAAGVCQRAGP